MNFSAYITYFDVFTALVTLSKPPLSSMPLPSLLSFDHYESGHQQENSRVCTLSLGDTWGCRYVVLANFSFAVTKKHRNQGNFKSKEFN